MTLPILLTEGPFSLRQADSQQAAAVDQLLQLCLHEFSIYGDGRDVGADGRYEYPYLHLYWSEDARHPYVFEYDGKVAGMALVRTGDPHEMAEFFVLNRYRRRGLATWAARQLFALHPGNWKVHELGGNVTATAFWRQAIPYRYSEVTSDAGVVQSFEVPPT